MGYFARLMAAVLTAGAVLAPAVGAAEPIQPGAQISGCTLAFVMDGQGPLAGKVYALSAAHCFDDEDAEVLDSDDQRIGHIVFLGDMLDRALDFALIEIAPEHTGRVDPAMRGHPDLPKGVATVDDVGFGDWLQMSGWGGLTSFNEDLREDRQAVLTEFDGAVFNSAAPVSGGDSGGPIAHVESGKAVGVVSGWVFHRPGNLIGPTVGGIVDRLANAGYPVRMRSAGEPPPPPPPPPPSSSAPAPAPRSAPPPESRTKPKKARKKKCVKRKRGARKGKRRCRRARR